MSVNECKDVRCAVCGFAGSTGHDLTWSERRSAWVHSDHCGQIGLLSTQELRQLVRYMLQTAEHADTKQWMRDGTLAVFANAVKKAVRRLEKRLGRKVQP